MKKILLLIVMLVPLVLFSTETHIPAGPVSGTWTISGSPYLIDGEIYVDRGDVLVIQAGVEVQFTGFHKFIVYGSLIAAGDEEHYIRFTTDDPSKKRWNGIRFMQNADICLMDYCIVQYSRSILTPTSMPDNGGGGIQVMLSHGKVSILNSIIRNNEAWFGGGIQILYASPIIENCKVIFNAAVNGGGIEGHAAGNPIIKNCRIAYNEADYGAGVSLVNCYPYMRENTIVHNTAEIAGGGLRAGSSNDFIVEKSIIAFNEAKNGAGVYLFYSMGDFRGNTIAFNTASNLGGGLYLTGSNPHHRSDLIYFNEADVSGQQVYLGNNSSDPDFEHCNIRGGTLGFSGPGSGINFTGTWKACIDGDPLFSFPVGEDFDLTWNNYPYVDESRSPCIDAGCPGVFVEPDGTCCDIGAKCYLQVIDVPVGLEDIYVTETYFIARWNKAYGALGYYLDVAYDPDFVKTVPGYNGLMIEEDTAYPVTLPMLRPYWYYRVRAYNSVLLSANSNPHYVLMNPGAIDESDVKEVNIFSLYRDIHVNIDPNIKTNGELIIYNMAGQLLHRQGVAPGDNTFDIPGPDQIVIVKLLLDGEVYQQKLLLH